MQLPSPTALSTQLESLVTAARTDPSAEREIERLLLGALWHCLDTGQSTFRAVVDRYAGYRRLIDGAEDDPEDPFGLRYDLTHSRHTGQETAMVCVSMTRYCQLRCSYCKFRWWVDNEIPADTLPASVDLLFSSSAPRLHLDFVGGEPLLFANRVLEALDQARKLEQESGKTLQATVVTNAMLLTEELADELAARGVRMLISLDGGPERMARFRLLKKKFDDGKPLYETVVENLKYLIASGYSHQVVMTVPPQAAGSLAEDFAHIVGLGARSIQVQYGIGWPWSEKEQELFLRQMDLAIQEHVVTGRVALDNLLRREPILLDATPTIEPDGTFIMGSDCMLENERKDPLYVVGRVPGVSSLDPIGGSPFHTLYMLTRHYGDHKEAHRRIIRDNVRMGYALERLLEGYRDGKTGSGS